MSGLNPWIQGERRTMNDDDKLCWLWVPGERIFVSVLIDKRITYWPPFWEELKMLEVTLIHVGGDFKTLPVEHISPNLSYLSVRWGQSGVYDLNLKNNVLTARSQKTQRKGKCHWKAADIDLVRRQAKEWLDAKNGKPLSEMEANYHNHLATMPDCNGQ